MSRRAKRRKLALEEDDDAADKGAMRAAVRSAKKAIRPAKIGMSENRATKQKTRGKEKKKRRSESLFTGQNGRSVFDRDMGQKRGAVREGARARSGDAIKGLSGKKGTGGKGKTKAKGAHKGR